MDKLDYVLLGVVMILQLLAGIGTLVVFPHTDTASTEISSARVIQDKLDELSGSPSDARAAEIAQWLQNAKAAIGGAEDYKRRLIGYLRHLGIACLFAVMVQAVVILRISLRSRRSAA
jgi:hypothetical protein